MVESLETDQPRRRMLVAVPVLIRVLLSILLTAIAVNAFLRPDGPRLTVILWLAGLLGVFNWWSSDLPTQNWVFIILSMAGIGVLGTAAGLATRFPISPLTLPPNFESNAAWLLAWMPLAWIMVLLLSRATARWLLSPCYGTRNFGIWLLGLSCLLAVILELAIEFAATRVANLWVPGGLQTPLFGRLLAWVVLSAGTLAILAPWFINKRPGLKKFAPYPAIQYAALLVFLVIASTRSGSE